jgi:membrane-associated phospholipid phosphatase
MKPAPWEALSKRSKVISQHGTAPAGTSAKSRPSRIEDPLVLPRADPSEPQMDAFVLIDERYSQQIYDFGKRHPTLRLVAILLEYLLHGALWLAVVFMAFLFQTNPGGLRTILANLFFGLVIDVALCSLVKVMVRRQRPHYNQGTIFASVKLDEYSFPSGHSSRGAFLWMFFCAFDTTGTSFLVKFVLILAPIALALSRVLLGRHFLSDAVCGLFFGWFFYVLLLTFWLHDGTVDVIWEELRMTVPLSRLS